MMMKKSGFSSVLLVQLSPFTSLRDERMNRIRIVIELEMIEIESIGCPDGLAVLMCECECNILIEKKHVVLLN